MVLKEESTQKYMGRILELDRQTKLDFRRAIDCLDKVVYTGETVQRELADNLG